MPYNANLALQFEDGVCSAVSIGTYTAISAGHCFFDKGAWYNFDPEPHGHSYIAPGANVGNGAPNDFPWGKYYCYMVWMYQGWMNNTSSHYYDMSVMDFSGCGGPNNSPGWVAGYTGYYVSNYQWFQQNIFVDGYPFDFAGKVGWPQLTGMSGKGTTNCPYECQYILTQTIDTSGGDSGTSWSWTNPSNGWFQVIGTHIGDWGAYPWQTTTNYARQLDSTYWNLVTAASYDY